MSVEAIVRPVRLKLAGGAERRGFTMVDLMITALIMGILAAVAAPKFAVTLHRMRTQAAARRIKADLTLARRKAMASSSLQAVQFSLDTHSYTLPGVADLDRPSQPYTVQLTAPPWEAALASVDLTGGVTQLQFDQYGQPDTGGTVTVEAGGHLQTVTIDANSARISIP